MSDTTLGGTLGGTLGDKATQLHVADVTDTNDARELDTESSQTELKSRHSSDSREQGEDDRNISNKDCIEGQENSKDCITGQDINRGQADLSDGQDQPPQQVSDPIVYIDGACKRNGDDNATAGIGIFWGEGHHLNLSKPIPSENGTKLTNNRAEILAAITVVTCS